MGKKVKKVLPLFVLIVAVSYAALPLFLPGFIPTHDGEYHIIRFWEFEKMLRAGYFFPRWASGLNSGYGLPLFNFHYPFGNYIGALFHTLGWNLTDSFKLALSVGYVTAIAFCYLWLKKLFDKSAATVGSVVFALAPYWFVDLYVRGSVGEVIAIAWFMILLASVERRWYVIISLAIAGIIVSHNILAMIFVPLAAGYVLFRHKQYIFRIAFGIGLSSYFWIPALIERKYMIGLNTVNFREHFPELFQLIIPSWGTGFSVAGIPAGEMSQQIGVIALIVTMAAGILLSREKERRMRWLIGGGLMLLGLLTILMLSVSQPLWEILIPLQLLQYPWRLLSVVIPLAGLFGAYVASRFKGTVWRVVMMLAAVAFAFGYIRPVTYEPRDDVYYLSRREFTDGTSSLGNSFSTIWSPWKRERAKQLVEFIGGEGDIVMNSQEPLDIRFQASGGNQQAVRINILYYPGWSVTIDGKKQMIDYEKEGTLLFALPYGKHEVRAFFSETPLRTVANLISLISLFWLLMSGILSLHANRNKRIVS